ncbi:unnamed protein product [Arctia plantaginis]|uniref:Ornithine decarboxylase antizyme n=1 Tax=Arctia plantaginis TaxID=874455 RepID=A0A8S1AB48_ARCPL|nr:unnamed protein product [Arctia plantaginis]
MTKLIQQLNFSSSINNYAYYYDVDGIESNILEEKNYFGDGAVSRCAWAPGLCGGPDSPAHGSAPPGGVNGGAASPATPSTPTHDDNNRDLLSALLWASASSLASSAESLVTEPSSPTQTRPELQHQRREAVISKILDRKDRQPVKIDFKIYLTENTVTRWEAVLQGGTIYLRMPGVLQSGSKESFMLLLDFAEERLGCTNCIICVLKSRPDRATLLRTFMFMGFQLLPPNSPLMPQEITNPEYIFLHYNM